MLTAEKTAAICAAVNLILSISKLVIGKVTGSVAVLSDGLDSLTDVLSALIIAGGIWLSGREVDDEHPYGHERLENTASLLLADAMSISAAFVAHNAIERIGAGLNDNMSPIAWMISLVSVACKCGLSLFCTVQGKKQYSSALADNAANYRTDVITSATAAVGTLLSTAGLGIADLVAGMVICALIIKTAVEVFISAIDGMLDSSASDDVVEKLQTAAREVDGVMRVDNLLTRRFGGKLYVEIEISAKADISLKDGHDIAQNVHDEIERTDSTIKHCTVHVNPY